MKKIVLGAAVALAMAGTSLAVSSPADAAPRHHRHHHHHHRVKVCGPVYKTKVFWRHGHRHVVRVKVGHHCWWRGR